MADDATPIDDTADDTAGDTVHETVHGEVPEGLGPDMFRDHLERAAHGVDDAHVTLQDEDVFLGDIESIEAEVDDEQHSRVRLRNGVIIGGLSGAAIVAALATVRYRRRHR